MTTRTRQPVRPHPLFARFYAKVAGPALDKAGITEHRKRLLAGLTGEVVEIGAGNGLNFPHYPPEVTRVLAVEPEPRLRALAQRAATTAPVPMEVTDGVAEQLPVEDASFDAAVVCLMLCSVADAQAALTEIRRVLRALDATVWPLLMRGCHTGRDTRSAIAAAGFTITSMEKFAFPETRL